MPKNTFQNLSPEKKCKIFEAAVQEFSSRSFSEASINQIVKTAQIPRGSFYQYFEDKQDVYLFMCAEIAREKQQLIAGMEPLDPNASALDEFLYKTKVSLELGKRRPEYRRISMLMEKDESDFITGLRALSTQDLKRVTELFERDRQRGLIRPDVDCGLVIEMVYTLTMKEYFRAGMDSELFSRRMQEIIRIIWEGIAL